MRVCALSGGGNLGNRLENIRQAVGMMKSLGTVTKKSGVYETPPWGIESQPRFLNACVLLETELAPAELLGRLKEIERNVWRVERERWGPREIDIDILTCGGEVLNGAELTVPHPLMRERAFVLVPLCDIAPDLRIPPGDAVSNILEKTDRNGIVRVTSL